MLGVVVARHKSGTLVFHLSVPVLKNPAAPGAFTLERGSYQDDPRFHALVPGAGIVVREVFHPEATAAAVVFNGNCFRLVAPAAHCIYYIGIVLRRAVLA